MVKVHQAILKAKPQIDEAIVAAEKGTSGELVVVATKVAGSYGRQEGLLAFGSALVVYTAVGALYPKLTANPVIAFPVLFTGYALGLLLALAFPKLPFLIVSRRMAEAEAKAAAALAFQSLNVAGTKASTGVLIFIAETERTVVVQGDGVIAHKVSDAEWEGVRDAILNGIRAGDPAKGVIDGVGLAGALLRTHFPHSGVDTDELASEIHLS